MKKIIKKWPSSLLVVICLFLFNQNFTYSQIFDPSMVYRKTLYVGHFNHDAVKDTIIGVADMSRKYVPAFIVWGYDPNDNQIPDSLKVAYTQIQFPLWTDITIKTSIDKMNGDTICDFMFFMWGKQLVDTTMVDVAKAVVVFGTLGLNTQPVMDISLLDTIITQPYVGMSLLMGRHFIEPAYRDFSGVVSYKFNKRFEEEVPIKNYIDEPQNHEVKLYPNPAVYYTNLELNNIKPGSYSFQIISSTGNLLDNIDIKVEKTNSLSNIIDLAHYSSGVYYIRIVSATKLLGTYPVVVVH